MINFTVGPVMSFEDSILVASNSAPYFRTKEFSNIILETEKYFLDFLNAPDNSKAVFLTTSGTGGMEACVINILNNKDKILVVNGGSFGQRFAELCSLYGYEYDQIKCEFGTNINKELLSSFDNKGYTVLLVNMHETSSGILYNMDLISDFCRRNNILLVVDAISAFLADDVDMKKYNISVLITGSQKALAVQAGISLIAMDEKAIKRVQDNPERCMYLSLKSALKNMERGQTPYTPAVTTLLQIHKRFEVLVENGGLLQEQKRIAGLAGYFRDNIQKYPFEFLIKNEIDRSNAVTTLVTDKNNAGYLFETLKNEYGIWICPNGGEVKDRIFRVGHIGAITESDYDRLFQAFDKIC